MTPTTKPRPVHACGKGPVGSVQLRQHTQPPRVEYLFGNRAGWRWFE